MTKIVTKPPTKEYAEGWDRIFNKEGSSFKEESSCPVCWNIEQEMGFTCTREDCPFTLPCSA